MNTLKLLINNYSFILSFLMFAYLTILNFVELLNIKVPRFCYHERLSIAGNCRMCLIEIQSSLKPVISCATKIISGMKIFTTNSLIDNIRETVLEFLLLNHPLDCPVCDQGGECDLQDQTVVFGSEKSRLTLVNTWMSHKRSLFNKIFNYLIKSLMTRCIQCSRCIRYIDEYLFFFNFGLMGRGSSMEISNFINDTINLEFSSNLVELCPVGAITSKKNAYTKRNWETNSFETIDVFSSVGSNLRLDLKGTKIIRVLPKLNEVLNEDWVSNQSRDNLELSIDLNVKNPSYFFSDLTFNCSFYKIFYLILLIFLNFRNLNIYFVNTLFHFFLDSQFDFLSSLSLLLFTSFFSCNFVFNDFVFNIDNRFNFLLNKKLNHFFSNFYFLFYNIDLVKESPFLNLKIKKKIINKKKLSKLEYLGKNIISHFNLEHKSINLKNIKKVIKGKWFKFKLKTFSFLEGSKTSFLNSFSKGISTFWKKNLIYNSLKNQSSFLHLFESGISNSFFNSSSNIVKFSKIDFIFYFSNLFKKKNTFSINFTERIDFFFSNINIPLSSFYKSNDLYYNIEGLPQYSSKLLNNKNNIYNVSLFLFGFFFFFFHCFFSISIIFLQKKR